MLRRSCFLVCLFVAMIGGSIAHAQFPGRSPETLSLEDLSSFQSPPDNWSVVDSVWARPDQTHHLASAAGTGVLVNQPTEAAEGHLLSEWEHGDLEIAMDVLMPRGSNSGIYLQGRYEIQLLDSWGVQSPTFGDLGGIYERWRPDRPEGERGIGGHPPRTNVAKAPGLWQHLHIDFRAPRFNEEGEKIENARFETVSLNGVVIHRNVEVPGPTRGAAFSDESATGPLLIQGDHGPVAVKNIRYKQYQPGQARLSDLQYEVYEGTIHPETPLDSATVAQRGSADDLTPAVAKGVVNREEGDYAVVYEGTITVPRSGSYAFDLTLEWMSEAASQDRELGGGQFQVGEEIVIPYTDTSGSMTLRKGDHPFRLVYFERQDTEKYDVTLFVEGPQMPRQDLTQPAEGPPSSPILATPEGDPSLFRSFFRHGAEKRTHVISVGTPKGGHYAYDLAHGSLLRVWKGPFLRMNQMWEGRGVQQRARPLGSGPVFSGGPPLAVLPRRTAPWPDSIQRDVEHEYLGYRLDEQGRPTFRYRFEGLGVTDQPRVHESGGRLTRTIRLSGRPSSDQIFVRLLRATPLRRAGSHRFVAGDRQYYVTLEKNADTVVLRRSNGARELLLPVPADSSTTEIRYELTW
ncbi:MAG: family 16 glycoside hydrolase [Salinibacter sp.]